MKDHAAVKLEVIEFLKAEGRRPSKKALNEAERRLASSLNNYTCQTAKAFDGDFRAIVNGICPPKRKGRKPGSKLPSAEVDAIDTDTYYSTSNKDVDNNTAGMELDF